MKALFDVVHESCKTGARKPSPAAYSGVLEALKLSGSPQAAVFLDDIGTNLKVISLPNLCTCVVCMLSHAQSRCRWDSSAPSVSRGHTF